MKGKVIFLLILTSAFLFFINSKSVLAEENGKPEVSENVVVYRAGYKYIYHNVKSSTLAGLPNSYVYNDGIYSGILTLQRYSYEHDFKTGKNYFLGVYYGKVSTNNAPITRNSR